MKKIIIDFETRSEVDLRKVGPWVYAEHPSTEIMCIGYKGHFPESLDGVAHPNILRAAVPDKYFPKEFTEGINIEVENLNSFAGLLLNHIYFGEYIFEAHNAEFERAIWHHICHKRWGWPDIPVERWRCSAAKAAALSLPRDLDRLGKVLKAPVLKDPAGHRLMLKMCKPRKPLKKEKIEWIKKDAIEKALKYNIPETEKTVERSGAAIKARVLKGISEQALQYAERNMPTLWHEKPEDLIKLFKYCIQDVEAEACISDMMRDLSLKEQKLWEIDQRINTRGVKVDRPSIEAVIEVVKEREIKLLDELKTLTHGTVSSPRQVAAMKDWLKTKGLDLPDMQKETIKGALEHRPNLQPKARRALEIRQALSKSSVAKFNKLYISSNEDERCRGLLMYHGAGTGRWSGKRFQPQNLPRPEFKDVDACLEVIRDRDVETLEMLWGETTRSVSSCIRGVLISGKGKEFICGDFSSIEASVIGWYADEQKVLKAFAEKLDIYKVAAQDIYHTSYALVDTEQRRIGKVAVLALGFGGGVPAFQQMAPNYGVVIPDAAAEDIKCKWREAHPRIVQFWHDTENTVKKVIKTGRTMSMQKGMKWGVKGDFLFCKLPSGRLMAYYQPMIKPKVTPWGQIKPTVCYMAMNSETNQWCLHYSYGGKLVENIVQATARDLLADAIVRVEEAGYLVVLHVHDEILSEVPIGVKSVKEFEALMSVKPHWAEGCPVSVEGWQGKRYRK